MNIPNVLKPQTPAFTDIIIGQIQDVLKAKLPWLDYSFGRAQKLTKLTGQQKRVYPGVHLGAGEYLDVFPTDRFKNFSFFILEDPQRIEFIAHRNNKVRAKYALIFWVNLDEIFANDADRNTEAIKAQIIKVLTRETFLDSGRISLEAVYEHAENIYKGFSIKEVDSQFLMQPFAGFRFEGELTFTEPC
jgi:hypothetical protein